MKVLRKRDGGVHRRQRFGEESCCHNLDSAVGTDTMRRVGLDFGIKQGGNPTLGHMSGLHQECGNTSREAHSDVPTLDNRNLGGTILRHEHMQSGTNRLAKFDGRCGELSRSLLPIMFRWHSPRVGRPESTRNPSSSCCRHFHLPLPFSSRTADVAVS